MKKIIKRIFMAVGFFVLAAAVVILINVFPLFAMKPAETGKIADTEILVVKNKINSLYFIESTDGYILIDAGADAKAAEKSMKEENISPADVKHILLTHSDSDHIASLGLFPGAKIYMSEDETQMINGETKRNAFSYNSLPGGIEQRGIIPLQDSQELEIGGRTVKCVKSPGHTPGSMAYIVDGNYLFSGDSFKVSGNTMGVHPFTMDGETGKKSIQKLYEIMDGTELTLTSHYGYYKSEDLTADGGD